MKQSFLKTSNSIIKQIIDSETGELLQEDVVHNKFVANSKEEFFLGYVSLLASFTSLSGAAIKVYAYLLMNNKPGSAIGINRGIKANLMDFVKSDGKTTSTIDNALMDLCEANLLFRQPNTRGVYYINPRYAFKGSTNDRNSSLKAIIELGCENC